MLVRTVVISNFQLSEVFSVHYLVSLMSLWSSHTVSHSVTHFSHHSYLAVHTPSNHVSHLFRKPPLAQYDKLLSILQNSVPIKLLLLSLSLEPSSEIINPFSMLTFSLVQMIII